MHEKIVELFLQNPDKYVSGEKLSELLNCSRTAVWKHIRRLRGEGYEFESSPRLGYRLIRKPERIDTSKLLDGLRTNVMGRSVHLFERIDSTQTAAHELVRQGAAEGTLVIAEEQFAGRGRMGRKWHSPPGKGIWMSLVLKPRIPLHFSPQLTLLLAVALCRSIGMAANVQAGIKWPNDLLVGGKKVSGILLESNAEDERLKYAIAGIGVSANLAPDDYPEELRDKATSLFIESGKIVDREKLICCFLEQFEHLYDLYHDQGFAPIRLMWEALNVSLHRPVRVHSSKGTVEGFAESIDDLGALIIRLADGQKVKMYSGDVEIYPANI